MSFNNVFCFCFCYVYLLVLYVGDFVLQRSSASLHSATDCVSPKQRRWPEDVAWHPEGHSLFCVYTADAGDSQISVINLNKLQVIMVNF